MTEMAPEKLRAMMNEEYDSLTHRQNILACVAAWAADRHDTEVVRRNILEIVGELKTAHVRHEADLVRIEALERECNEWEAAARHLLEHYPEDVFPPTSNTPDAKAGTFARRLLTWLLDPVERARFAALAAKEETDDTHD